VKVSYTMMNGATSTAYLDDDPRDHCLPAVFNGVDRYTDEPVTVVLIDGKWVEVPSA
jgi:hypothetical protein